MTETQTLPIKPIEQTVNIDPNFRQEVAQSLRQAFETTAEQEQEEQPRQGDRLQYRFRIKIGGDFAEEVQETEENQDTENSEILSEPQITLVNGQENERETENITNLFQNGKLPDSSQLISASVRISSQDVSFDNTETLDESSLVEVSSEDIGSFQANGEDIPISSPPIILDQNQGDILGRPVLNLSTNSHSYIICLIDDEDGSILNQLKQHSNIEVQLGIPDIFTRNLFVGVIFEYGRHLPNATYVMGVDRSAIAKSTESAVTSNKTGIQQEKSSLSEAIVDFYSDTSSVLESSQTTTRVIQNGLVVNPNASRKSKVDLDKLHQQQRGFKTELSGAAQGGQKRSLEVNEIVKIESPDGKPLSVKNKTGVDLEKEGRVKTHQSVLAKAIAEAAQVGASIITQGNQTSIITNDNLEKSGVVLDYLGGRSAFFGKPRIIKPTPVQLKSAAGGFTVKGYDPRTESVIGATVVVPAPPTSHPNGIITVANFKDINLADPIIPGSPYTWSDATKYGQRVPDSDDVIQNIIRIAQIITDLTKQTVGNGKWTIISWYRPPAVNRAVGGAVHSTHMEGHGVDFSFPGMRELYYRLEPSYEGGLALGATFVHIDARKTGKARWSY